MGKIQTHLPSARLSRQAEGASIGFGVNRADADSMSRLCLRLLRGNVLHPLGTERQCVGTKARRRVVHRHIRVTERGDDGAR